MQTNLPRMRERRLGESLSCVRAFVISWRSWPSGPRLVALLLALVTCGSPSLSASQSQGVAGVRVRIQPLKRSPFERTVDPGPVLVGPQSALEFEWRLTNTTGRVFEMPSPGAALRPVVLARGREIRVRTEFAARMTILSTVSGQVVPSDVPTGFVMLADGASISVRGSTSNIDGSPFAPGQYGLRLDASGLVPQSVADRSHVTHVDVGYPIQLRVVGLDSVERQRQFHLLEGGFYKSVDGNRALDHYKALVALPGAPWSDSLELVRAYAALGRHREAAAVIRRILPELIQTRDLPPGSVGRQARLLRMAAMTLAIEGDTALAARLLELEGITQPSMIPAEIERWRSAAPRDVSAAAGTPK